MPPKDKQEAASKKKPIDVIIPRRTPSIARLRRPIIYRTVDKVICDECPCFKYEAPYQAKPRLIPCLQSPPTLYELTSKVVDSMDFPDAFKWSVEQVAQWMEEVVGLPRYKECILDNKINGMRLLMLEDISQMPKINIRDFEDIKLISAHIRLLFSLEMIKFARSIGLPYRLPLTYCTMFKSRTGPTWGIRQNWTRGDILRWMKILGPKPPRMDHWDLVWYQKPDFPKTMLARIGDAKNREKIPRFIEGEESCNEYLVTRKFRVNSTMEFKDQAIWMEHLPGDPLYKEPMVYPSKKKPKPPPAPVKHESRLVPKKIDLTGLAGERLILARRLMPKQKFFKGATSVRDKTLKKNN